MPAASELARRRADGRGPSPARRGSSTGRLRHPGAIVLSRPLLNGRLHAIASQLSHAVCRAQSRGRVTEATPRRHSLDQLRELLRSCGLRATGARMAVLEALEDAAKPLSNADLVDRIPAAHERTTIFRTLATLTRVRLVHRVNVGDRIWRYQRATGTAASGPVANFVCTNCSAVVTLSGVALSVEMAHTPQAIATHSFEVAVYGRCDKCAAE